MMKADIYILLSSTTSTAYTMNPANQPNNEWSDEPPAEETDGASGEGGLKADPHAYFRGSFWGSGIGQINITVSTFDPLSLLHFTPLLHFPTPCFTFPQCPFPLSSSAFRYPFPPVPFPPHNSLPPSIPDPTSSKPPTNLHPHTQQDLPGYPDLASISFPPSAYTAYTPAEKGYCPAAPPTCQQDTECCERASCVNRVLDGQNVRPSNLIYHPVIPPSP